MGIFDKTINKQVDKRFNDNLISYNNAGALNITTEVKKALSESNLYDNYTSIFDTVRFTKQDKKDMVVFEAYNETLPFYDTNFKSNVFYNLIKRITSNVIDDYEVLVNGENRQELVFDIKGKKIPLYINDSLLSNLFINSVLYKYFYIKLVNKGEYLTIEYLPPFKIKRNNNGDYMELGIDNQGAFVKVYKDNGEIKVLRKNKKNDWVLVETLQNDLGMTPIFIFDFDYTFVNEAVLELILQRSKILNLTMSEILTAPQKVFANSAYLGGGMYDDTRYVYRQIQTPDPISMDENGKPFFEIVNGELRSSSIREMLDINAELIAGSLMLDRLTLGLDSVNTTATEVKTKNVNAINTINSLKKEFKQAFNRLFIKRILKGSNTKCELLIERYQINDLSSKIELAQKALSSGSMSVERAIKFVNNELSGDDLLREQVLVKYERNIPLTTDEYNFAKANNIIPVEKLEQLQMLDLQM